MKRFIFFLIGALICWIPSIGQEHLVGLSTNPLIKQDLRKESGVYGRSMDALTYPKAIHLPFFEDFHAEGIFPDTALFTDNNVFINDDFPYRSANIGAATFDAINAYGDIYQNASMFPFIADELTSKPIRLDSLFLPGETRAITLADSLYFSFFYQPQGRGNQPESFDSLVLQFGYYGGDSAFAYMDSITVPVSSYLTNPNDTIFPLDTIYAPQGCNAGVYMINFDTLLYDDMVTVPCDSVFEPDIEWKRVWSSEGMPLDTFFNRYNTYSKQVIIALSDSATYYKEHFYFRFYNFASLASDFNPSWKSNCDQWNIDYIYLNVGRSAADTFYRNITFAERAPSFLTDLTSMPLRQYRNDPTNQLKDSLKLYITNLSADTFNVYYEYIIDAQGNSFTHTYNGGFANLYPFFNSGYQSCSSVPQHACPPRDFLFPLSSQEDSSSYLIRHVIRDQSNPDLGDTISFIQKFYNYYAYDDGTPELGYGLSIAGGKVGCRYTLNISDSLKGIAMFFNKVQNNQNDVFFHMKVWDNNNGKPGNLIWEKEDLKPKFSDELNRLQIYDIDPPIALLGTFFIGWEQTTADILNVGFDTHNDASEYLFFNANGTWEQSLKQGALLMRPILNTLYDPFLVEEIAPEESWKIYPNPVSGQSIFIENTNITTSELTQKGSIVSIYDMMGRVLLTQAYSHSISVSHLPRGLFLLHITSEDNSIHHIHKLLINK